MNPISPRLALPPPGVVGLTAVVWGVQILLGMSLPDAMPAATPFPWPILGLVFVIATSAVIHVHFKQESESFDLFDIPVVVGLMLFSPRELWIAQLAGTFVAVTLVRRQPPIKAIFNVGLLGMQTVITAHLFRLTVVVPNPSEPAHWGPLFIAIMFGSVLNVACIVAVVSMVEGRLDDSSLLHVFTYGGVVTLTNTGLGLIAAVLISEQLALVLPLVIPVTALFLAYRAYGAERDQRARLEILYRSTRSVSELGERRDSVERLLRESAEIFRATTVEFLLLGDRNGTLRRNRLGPDGISEVLQVIDPAEVAGVVDDAPDEPRLIRRSTDEPWGRYLGSRGIDTAMVTTVGNGGSAIGVLIVGDRRGHVASFGPEDLRMMGTIANHLAVAIERDRLSDSVAQLRRLEESLSHQARTDPLTGLLNRNGFESLIDEQAESEQRLAVAFLDLDDFKDVNDTFGHEAGDIVLASVAERIQAVVREGDAVARLGGDEFAIVFCATEHPEKVLPRLLEQVTKPITIGVDQTVVVGSSIGLAISRPEESTSQTIRNADIAMFTAKATGKNTYQVFDDEIAPVDRRPSLDQALRAAVDNDAFSLYYQPIVDLASGETVGFESLLRWRSDHQGLLLPAEFLRDAQDTGAIIPIEQWAIRRAAEDLREIEAGLGTGPAGNAYFTTLNISAEHLARHAAIEVLIATTESLGLEPSRVMLEISEDELMRATADLSRTLQAIRHIGFAVAIDDFGSGDASLGIVRRNEVDAVKIAKTVIAGLAGGERPYMMAMIELARNLGLQLIAEGVETESQRQELLDAGITLGQGYFFARPQPLADVLANSRPPLDRRIPPQALG